MEITEKTENTEKIPTETKKQKKTLTRFNVVYDDPYQIFCKYLKGEITFNEIGHKCSKGMIYPESRSTFYKIFLGILPYNDPGSWKNKITQLRQKYYDKLNNLLSKNKIIIDFINCHFLKGSPQYEALYSSLPKEDNDLLSLIKLDVDRTFQDLDLFHDVKVKEILCKILYVFSKDNPDPSYCQGMNEILGTLFYAFLSSIKYDKFTPEQHEKENNGKVTNVEMLYSFLVNNEHLEADLFIIYSELMSRDLTLLYMYNDDKFVKKDVGGKQTELNIEELEKNGESDLVIRIKKIFYIQLPSLDKSYFDKLCSAIEPSLFLLRWILCLLDREISLKHVLWIWDSVLFYEFVEFTFLKKDSDKKYTHLNFLDMVCLSMIMNLKEEVKNSEPSIILCRFMKFPNEKNIRNILYEAVNLAPKFNGNINIWDNPETKVTKNYLDDK